jgi:hypothetical protein
MKPATLAALAALTIAPLTFAVGPTRASASETGPAPRIEVCFVLDTTGSMVELIDGAKQKIWSITSQMATAKPAPQIKLGLIGFRDHGDEYVTKAFDLTDDLDDVYGHLIAFQAAGGGDIPESVNQALNEAVTKMSWSKDRSTLKVIFLVGDAPPHMDYLDDVKYPETAQLAARSDIIINTIQAGAIAQTTPFWQEIASKADGQFVRIEQTGGMKSIATPVDAELSRLSVELSTTVVPWGDALRQTAVRTKNAVAADSARGGIAGGAGAAASATAADRVLFLNLEPGAAGSKTVVTGEGELIKDLASNKVKLEDIKESDLPPQMRTMTMEERKQYVAGQTARRAELQAKVDALAKQRVGLMKVEMSKLPDQSNRDSFDAKIADLIRGQGLKKGIHYDAPEAGQ